MREYRNTTFLFIRTYIYKTLQNLGVHNIKVEKKKFEIKAYYANVALGICESGCLNFIALLPIICLHI